MNTLKQGTIHSMTNLVKNNMIYLKAYTRMNLGDDLFIKKICSKYPNQKFCILADKKYKKIFKNIRNLKIMSYNYSNLEKIKRNYAEYRKKHLNFIKRICKKCNAHIYIGGSIFIENGKISLDRTKDLIIEMNNFEDRYIIGANFGPYVSKEYFDCVHDELVPSLNRISFRDLESHNLFDDLENATYAPDVLFSLEVPNNENKKKELGISLIHHLERKELKNKYDEYLEQLKKISIKYIKNGYTIRLFSFCSYEKDNVAIDEFLNRMPTEYKSNIEIEYYEGDIDNMLDKISKLDTIIATRFHSIVLGLKCGCNVIPICYSNKSVNLLNDLKITEYVTFENVERLLELKSNKLTKEELEMIEKKSKQNFEFLKINQ